MRYVWISLAVIAAALILAYAADSLLPGEHTATLSRSIGAPPERVFAIITDFGSGPGWRTGLKSVRVEADGVRYVEESSNGRIPFRVIERVPDSQLVTEIETAELPFGGTWTFGIKPAAGGSEVSITENGFVGSPFSVY